MDLCAHPHKYTGRLIPSDGRTQVKDYCPDCDRTLTGAKKATRLQHLTLPVFRDNRTDPDTPCDSCGTITHLQLHHWAPVTSSETTPILGPPLTSASPATPSGTRS